MADEIVTVPASPFQDTGNPILDSVVNLLAHRSGWNVDDVRAVHEVLLEIAAKEPGGLVRRGHGGGLRATGDRPKVKTP